MMLVLHVPTRKSPLHRRRFHLNYSISLLDKIIFLWLYFFYFGDKGHGLFYVFTILRTRRIHHIKSLQFCFNLNEFPFQKLRVLKMT